MKRMTRKEAEKINYTNELKYLETEFERVRKNIEDVKNVQGLFIPLSDWVKTFDRPMFMEEHNEELLQIINRYKKDLKELALEYGYIIEDHNGYMIHTNAGLPILRISTSTEEEKQLGILQKDTLEKLDELGYGVYIEDDFIVPIPLFFSKEHFPVKLSTPDGEIKSYDTWEEIKAIII